MHLAFPPHFTYLWDSFLFVFFFCVCVCACVWQVLFFFACLLHLNGSIQLIQQIILLLCPNPLYEYTSTYISILLLIGIWLVSSVGLLWIKPLWTLYIGYKSAWALRWCRRGKFIEASILSFSPEFLFWNSSVFLWNYDKQTSLAKEEERT